MTYAHILYDVQDDVAHVTLNRPERMNALGIGPGSNRDELARAFAEADADPAVACVLLDAAGRAFCGGGDLTGSKTPQTVLDEYLFGEQLVKFYAGIRALHKPVVAAVNGLCLGAGLGLIAQCDLVVAAEDARFGLIEGRIGHPGATEIVPLVGAAWAKFLILTGELIDARRAADIGLVLTVVESGRLAKRARDLALRIARLPREAVLLNKATVDAMNETLTAAARRIGRQHDAITKSMARHAKAPDGRSFEAILRAEGIEGLKRARDQQFTGPWLERDDNGRKRS